MIKEALQYIVGLSKPLTTVVGGVTYATKGDMYMLNPSFCPPLAVHTLDALVQYVANDVDHLLGRDVSSDKFLIMISEPTLVEVMLPMYGEERYRPELLRAKPSVPVFQFGEFISGERMVVALQSMFAPSEDRGKLLAVCGNVQDGETRNYTDDGVSQAVTIKAGVAIKTEVALPNPVKLAPYRSFPEITPIVSDFVFRAKSGKEGEKPTFALFEADGGAWRVDTMNAIKAYLAGKFNDVSEKVAILQ